MDAYLETSLYSPARQFLGHHATAVASYRRLRQLQLESAELDQAIRELNNGLFMVFHALFVGYGIHVETTDDVRVVNSWPMVRLLRFLHDLGQYSEFLTTSPNLPILAEIDRQIESYPDDCIFGTEPTPYADLLGLGVRRRERITGALLRGLAGGLIEVVDGSLANPTVISIRINDPRITDALVDARLEIPNVSGFSSWPNVITAFERFVISVDPPTELRAGIGDTLIRLMPELLTRGDVAIPQVLFEIVRLKETEIEKLRASKYIPGLLPDERSTYPFDFVLKALNFWEEALPRALHEEAEGGWFRNLHSAMEHTISDNQNKQH